MKNYKKNHKIRNTQKKKITRKVQKPKKITK